jgi:hypothetical protein
LSFRKREVTGLVDMGSTEAAKQHFHTDKAG